MSDLVSSILHLGGAAVVLLATPLLLRAVGRSRELWLGALVQTGCAASLLVASGTYHLASHVWGQAHALTEVLLRVDRAGVWLIFAGFFVLPHLILERGAWRWGLLAVVWLIASAGMVANLLVPIEVSTWQLVVPHALANVLGLVSTARFLHRRGVRKTLGLLVFWLAFAAGAVCFVFHAPTLVPGWFGHHELWHVAVLTGIYAHWHFVTGLGPEADEAFPASAETVYSLLSLDPPWRRPR